MEIGVLYKKLQEILNSLCENNAKNCEYNYLNPNENNAELQLARMFTSSYKDLASQLAIIKRSLGAKMAEKLLKIKNMMNLKAAMQLFKEVINSF